MPLAFAILCLAFIAIMAAAGKLPAALIALYLCASAATFALYAIDKRAARNGRWRTPERTLHLLAVVGGWPGALLAQRLLRHKSKKRSFLVLCWITVLLNCGGLVCLALKMAPSR